jgi:hypothetical protein
MKVHYNGTPINTKIANIEASPDFMNPQNSFPFNSEQLPNLNPETRGDYARHTLYGLNVFLNEMVQQFPLILGFAQIDSVDPSAKPALLTAREEVLKIARQETARVQLSQDNVACGATLCLNATVMTSFDAPPGNPGPVGVGHKFPSGVGFRRAFIELRVLGDNDEVLWASGQTDSLGVIVDRQGQPLPTEFFQDVLGCPARANVQCYQPHYQVINQEDQVQIYEELHLNANPSDVDARFNTSFLHRYYKVKDNRILPAGWRSNFVDPTGRLADVNIPAATGPDALAASDPDYPSDRLTRTRGRHGSLRDSASRSNRTAGQKGYGNALLSSHAPVLPEPALQ